MTKEFVLADPAPPNPVPPTADPVDDVLPMKNLLLYGLQHVLVMAASPITAVFLVAQTLGFDAGLTVSIISATFLVCGLGSILQTRLMDVAGDAQTLAAALNHSAFNTANAIGPLLGGMAVAAGWGWTSTGWVGVALSLGGFAVWVVAWLTGRKTGQSHA